MAVSGKFLALALASVAAVGLASSASAVVQVATLNGGNPIVVPPSVQYDTDMNWAAGSATGVVEFTLGSTLTLTQAGFVNSGISSNVFTFSDIHIYAGSFSGNGNSTAGLTLVSTPANEQVLTVPHAAWLLPTTLGIGSYSLVYNGTASSVTSVANVNGNISFESPVPEAATWMMMVAGFGMMGAAMRRRPRAQVTFA